MQAVQLEELRAQFEEERSKQHGLAERIEVLEHSMVQAESRVEESFLRWLAQKLPGPIRTPLWRVYQNFRLLIAPSSEGSRRYRSFREAARTQRASLRIQKKLFGRVLSAKDDELADIIVFPVIDWHFRIQRPQQVATALARSGHRVFYLTTTFSPWPGRPGFNVIESPTENVFICQLYCRTPDLVIYDCCLDPEMALDLARGLDVLRKNFHLEASVEIVQHPFWRQVASLSGNATVVYDCMDNHAGFSTGSETLLREEEALFEEADLVVTTSGELSKLVGKHRDNVLIRNAADVEHFSRTPQVLALKTERPVVGYYGAISAWFDSTLLAEAAKALPEWDFVLVGDTFESDVRELELLPNVRFEGEVSYETLPSYLHAFDVCVIPFKINDLIRCTNPVKVYEYLSAGKPVVATPMPELLLLGDLVHIAETSHEFVVGLKRAMDERKDETLSARRIEWARTQTWQARGQDLLVAIKASAPRVSVVVLCFNNLELTRACLHSLEQFSNHP
ncbi:MAG: glycosyltransferase, partial [Myxococcota bacterium]